MSARQIARVNSAAASGDLDALRDVFASSRQDGHFVDCMRIAAAHGQVEVIEWMLSNEIKPRGDYSPDANFRPEVLVAAMQSRQLEVIRFLGRICTCPSRPVKQQTNSLCHLVSCTNQFQWRDVVMTYPFSLSEEDGIKSAEISWDVMMCVAQAMPTYSVFKQILFYAIAKKEQTVIDDLRLMRPSYYELYMKSDFRAYHS